MIELAVSEAGADGNRGGDEVGENGGGEGGEGMESGGGGRGVEGGSAGGEPPEPH